MSPPAEGNAAPQRGRKLITSTSAVTALALAVWLFFWLEGMPLDAGSTFVVVIASTVLVVVTGWLWNRFHSKSVAQDKPAVKE